MLTNGNARKIIRLMADLLQYIASLDQIPIDLGATLAEHGWDVIIAPPRIGVLKCGESLADREALREELQGLLDQSETRARIMGDSHLLIPPHVVRSSREERLGDLPLADLSTKMHLMSTAGISEMPRISWPGSPEASPAAGDGSQTPKKPAETPPAASERAALVEKGLPALALPENLWACYIDEDERDEFAKTIAEDLYSARIEYARRVGWVLAPELELLDRLDRLPKDPEVTASKTMTKEFLRARIDMATYESNLVEQDVELKKELLKQQSQVTQLLDEFVNHAREWRHLANTGKSFLIYLTVFATAVTGFLAYLLFDGKLDAWAFPAAVFVLALFAISPAVLLIIERPLKGIDQWMPGGKPEDAKPDSSSASSGDAGTSKPSAPADKSAEK